MNSPGKRFASGLVLLSIIGGLVGWKFWQRMQTDSAAAPTQVHGPAVILFRGDNSPSCQAIHRLVDDAAMRFDGPIHFVRLDWAEGDPLIEKYQVRFLPTVVILDRQEREVGRVIGESAAVQRQLQQTLAQLDALLEP